MLTNLYGPGDNYDPEYSHVIAALIRRFHQAKLSGASNVVVWAPARHAGSFSMSTTWPTPACT
jgi:nucleoside-diphosphate-sugar epimerase